MTRSLINLAHTALNQDCYTEARQLLEEGLALAQESGDRLSVVHGLEEVALKAATRNPRAGVELLAAAQALRSTLHSTPYPPEREPIDNCLNAARTALRADAYDAAQLTGERLGIEDAIAGALRVVGLLNAPAG